jgi:chromosome segregation ATPase
MTDTFDKRVGELETLVWEIPNLLNVRFARFETEFISVRGAIADNTTRLASLERTMTALQTDMRDLRGGVTRQLVEQDRRLGTIEKQLEEQDRRLGAIEQQLAAQDRRLAAMESDVAAIKADVAEVLSRLPKP